MDPSLLNCLCTLLHVVPDDVRLNESFVSNGGDSLLAIKFGNLIRRSKNIQVGAAAILKANSVRDLLDEAALRRLATRPTLQTKPSPGTPPIVGTLDDTIDDKTLDPIQRFPKVIPSSGLPITSIQAGTAHYAHLIPGAAVQHVIQYCFTDALPRLRSAFEQAMSSYQSLRLKLEVQTDPLSIRASLKQSFVLDWVVVPHSYSENIDLESLFKEWSIKASSKPLFRILATDEVPGNRRISVVHWFYHLSLMDGRSMDILLGHVDGLMGSPASSPTVNDRIFDVTRGLADYHHRHEHAAKEFWATREIPPEARNHPLLQPLGTRTTSRVHMETIELFFAEDVKIFQQRVGCTFEILVRAAMALVLAKLQGASTVSLMSVTSRRALPIDGIEEAVGSFAASMILTIDVSEEDTPRDLLSQVFSNVMELEVVSYSDPSDGFSLGGLVVISSDIRPHAPWYSDGKQTDVMSPKETLPTIYVGASGRLRVCFNSQWRTVTEMRVMTDLLQAAMTSLASGAPSIGRCLEDMLTKSWRDQIMEWGNCRTVEEARSDCEHDIVSLFENQAVALPHAPALELRGKSVSYQDLALEICAVGRRIQDFVEPGSVILIHADGSIEWVVAMFAVLWAGCVFSPQGVALPHQLRSRHSAIAEAAAFLVPLENDPVTDPDDCELRLCVETILREVKKNPSTSLTLSAKRRPTPQARAYICFSSGTTGQPKAIQCTHTGIVSLLRDAAARLGVVPGHRVAQIMSPPFDGALLEVFSALCYGGTLVLKNPEDPFGHLQRVDSMLLTPSLAAELNPDDYHNLKYIYLGAELLPQSIADRWSAGQASVYNIYGPTECHIVSTVQRIMPGRPVTIGKPVASTHIYILDERGNMVPPLVTGEIYIGGPQVSQGYIGLANEMRLRFLPDTVCPGEGMQMYRTGDWGYWSVDGEIAFVGRTDRQVKLGGFRINLNDVQARIRSALPLKCRVAIVVVADVLGCLVTDAHGLRPETISAVAKSTLPPQQVPRIIRCTAEMPLTAVGKLDYLAVARALQSS